MTIEVHWSYPFLFAAKGREDENLLKYLKTGQFSFKFADSVFRKTPTV